MRSTGPNHPAQRQANAHTTMKTRGQKRDRKQPDMFVAVPASGKRQRRNKNGKTTKTKTEAKAKAKTVVKVAKRGGGKAAVADGAAACAAAKSGRSTAPRGNLDKQAHGQVVTCNSKPVQQRKKRGPYKMRKKQPTTTAAKKTPADTTYSTTSSLKAPRKKKNDCENADVDNDESSVSSSSSSSSSSTDEARSSRSIGEISVQSNTRAKRTSTGSTSKPSPSYAPSESEPPPVIDDADKIAVGGASSSSLLQSPIVAMGSPTRLSISKLQSPLRSPLRLPASAAAAVATAGRSVGIGASPGKQPKRHRPGCIPQFLGEDILCDTGLAFLPPDYDDPGEDESLEHWRAKYENGPGVTRAQMTASATKATGRSRQHARRGSSGSVGSSGSAGGSGGTSGSNTVGGSSSDHQRYKSVVRYNGAPINLGTHRTSAAAVAMQDLADLALLGSEHDKKMQLLSRDEAWMALHTAKLPGVHPYGQVDQFSSLFSANYKPVFEEKMEDALASIGGQDDMLAEVLCSLDNETQRQAEAADASVADQLNRVRKYKEKQVARRSRRAEKLLKKHLAVKPRRTGPVNAPRFQQDHGIYGVGDDGKIFWFRIKDHAEVRQREITMREYRRSNTDDPNKNGEKSMDVVKSSDNFAPDLGYSQDGAIAAPADGANTFDDHDEDSDHEEADDNDGSMVSSSSSGDLSSAASSISSAASGDPSGKVRILPFDDDEAASANKQQNVKAHSRETRAPGIPDAITITSTNIILSAEERGKTTATETTAPAKLANSANNEVNEMNLNLPPRDLLISSALAPKSSLNSADSELQRVHAMLSEFDVTPLLSFSPNGMKVSKGEKTGKTLTGIKFTRKGCASGGVETVNEFTIDVRVNNQSSDEATLILNLR